MNVFAKINEAIGPAGLVGLDKLYSHMIKTDLELLISSLQHNILNEKSSIDLLNAFHNETAPSLTKTIHHPLKFYNNYVSKFVKNTPKVFDLILKIGQKQIIRKYIAFELNSSCKFNSKNLESSLRTMNDSLLHQLRSHELDSRKPHPDEDLLVELNKYLEWAGIYNPYEITYVETKTSKYIGTALFMLTNSNLSKLIYVKHISTLMGKRLSDHIDGTCFVIGVMTVLKQFHIDIICMFISQFAQFVASMSEYNLKFRKELGTEVHTSLHFLFKLIEVAGFSRDILEKCIPEVILNQLEYLSSRA